MYIGRTNTILKNLTPNISYVIWYLKKKTRGPWATSLTWEKVQIIKQIWLYDKFDSENKDKTLCEFIGSSFEQTWIPFTQGCFVPRLVEICPVVLEKEILKFRKCVFSLFHNYLPLEKGWALHLNKPKSPSPKDALCQVELKLAQWFWRRRFLNFVNVFSLFV